VDDTSTNSWAALASAYTGTPASRSSISEVGRAPEVEAGEVMRAQGGGGGSARGKEEKKEVTWAWIGRKGLGKRGLGLVSMLEVPPFVVGFLSHGNWNRKGMAATVAAGDGGRWESRRGERQGRKQGGCTRTRKKIRAQKFRTSGVLAFG
jgi:hypothetical protein